MNKRLAKDMKTARYGCTKPDIVDWGVDDIDHAISTLYEAWPYGSDSLNAQHREVIRHLRAARREAKRLWKNVCDESWRSRNG